MLATIDEARNKLLQINKEIESLERLKIQTDYTIDLLGRLRRPLLKIVPQPDFCRPWYKGDARSACRECGKPTRWRHPRGWAQCPPPCDEEIPPIKKVSEVIIDEDDFQLLFEEEVE